MSILREVYRRFQTRPLWLRLGALALVAAAAVTPVAAYFVATSGDGGEETTEVLAAVSTRAPGSPTSGSKSKNQESMILEAIATTGLGETPAAVAPTPTPGSDASSMVIGPDRTPVAQAAAATDISPEAARARLEPAVLQKADVPADYTDAGAGFQTSEEALAGATGEFGDTARRLFAEWGRAYVANSAFAAPPTLELAANGAIARVSTSAWLFGTADGASACVAYLQGFDASAVTDFVAGLSSEATPIRNVTAEPAAYPALGDGSFAWRIRGTITVSGFDLSFVADAVFARKGDVVINIVAATLNQPPPAAEVERYLRLLLDRTPSS